ncbi:hypothetical protein DUNSADRAFT_17644 [Dunaliella salina]|uniref:Encoded protein n=1 Tax=Dunaliella salina TaxID=3046 RepID=A0ABQ7G1E1_DUNSA|nr:hypothetical protein DUNSADRAFT_17644 [Dunaliella salina]|eukprot:KAF5828425.1 hypothetical protein DUNSADRAFT_17644 [Dunaliella salina]
MLNSWTAANVHRAALYKAHAWKHKDGVLTLLPHASPVACLFPLIAVTMHTRYVYFSGVDSFRHPHRNELFCNTCVILSPLSG